MFDRNANLFVRNFYNILGTYSENLVLIRENFRKNLKKFRETLLKSAEILQKIQQNFGNF